MILNRIVKEFKFNRKTDKLNLSKNFSPRFRTNASRLSYVVSSLQMMASNETLMIAVTKLRQRAIPGK